jgi:hypothetical protein
MAPVEMDPTKNSLPRPTAMPSGRKPSGREIGEGNVGGGAADVGRARSRRRAETDNRMPGTVNAGRRCATRTFDFISDISLSESGLTEFSVF